MLRISDIKLRMFDTIALDRDIDELSHRLADEHSEESAKIGTDMDRKEFVRISHNEASSCGIRLKPNVYLFAEARLLLGPGFHVNRCQMPELVLHDEKACEDGKADAISEELALREVFG
jgi:hypothetical protein